MWLEVRGGGEEGQVQLGGLAGVDTAAAALYSTSTVKPKATLQFITGVSPSCWPMLTVASGSEDSCSSSRPSAASRAYTTSTDQLTNQNRPTSRPADRQTCMACCSLGRQNCSLSLGSAALAGRGGEAVALVRLQYSTEHGTGRT